MSQERALHLLQAEDAYAAIEYLCRQSEPLSVGQTFADLVRHLYWEKKDVFSLIVVAQAGIQYCLTASLAADDPEVVLPLRARAKALSYDLGSFTWPGWEEPGIVLTPTDITFGREAAKLNLRLATELRKEALPMSRAHWLLAAHGMANNDTATASHHFEKAREYAHEAGAQGEELLCSGFLCLVRLLNTPDDTVTLHEWEALHRQLETVEDGAAFGDQLETARRVFSRA